MMKGAFLSLALGIHKISHRSALHENNRLMSILSEWCCSQSINIFRIGIPKNLLEADSRNMMTLIHNNHTIVPNQILYLMIGNE